MVAAVATAMATAASAAIPASYPGPVFDVTAPPFGAVGDGKTVDSAAVRQAFAACGARGGGTVLFPKHHLYVTGPFNISSDTTVVSVPTLPDSMRASGDRVNGGAMLLDVGWDDSLVVLGNDESDDCVVGLGA